MSTDERSALLVGSIPLRNAEEVFTTVTTQIGDRVRRIPDGETGPRADWIVWQYPVVNANPEFEVGPPDSRAYRSLPKLRLRDAGSLDRLSFEELGYSQAALFSYDTFARLKRSGVIAPRVKLQVTLPTPLAPISAFVASSDQAQVEPIYEERMLEELRQIIERIPHDQLCVQWDTNFEFGMLAGWLPAWFSDVRAGVVERLVRLARTVPGDVELGFHFCLGHDRPTTATPNDLVTMVEVANVLAGSLSRPLNWLHLPLLQDPSDYGLLDKLNLRPETELYLGVVNLDDGESGTKARIAAAEHHVETFGIATECGWGRLPRSSVPELLELHRALSTPVAMSKKRFVFSWPEGFERIPDEPWTRQPVDEFGAAYDRVDQHGWYHNLDPTVDELVNTLQDGDIVIDYSGGTGILIDRLKLRLFDAEVGSIIVDSSPKFLGVALHKFQNDPSVAIRHLAFLRDEKRLQGLDEALGAPLANHKVDLIVTTNAIHLYPDLPSTAAAWVRVLKPGGLLLVNSGNIRNPRAKPGEWILDETVRVISGLAEGIVRSNDSFGAYRPLLEDKDRMAKHAQFRDRVFHDPRPLDYYLQALEGSGIHVERVRETTIDAGVDDWFEMLSAYHDAVIGWLGGTEKIDGAGPSDDALADRMRLLRSATDLLFGGRRTFRACWTYLTCRSVGSAARSVSGE